MLAPLSPLAAGMALHHHEAFDGSGYPHGLVGRAIPLSARVLMLCDVYEALRESRDYKGGLGHDDARRVMLEGDGRTRPAMFDPDLLALFGRHHLRYDGAHGAFQARAEAAPARASAPARRLGACLPLP